MSSLREIMAFYHKTADSWLPNFEFKRSLLSLLKEIRVKNNLLDWFDAVINEEIERRDKSFGKFKKSRLHSDNESYKKARNKVQCMIKNKTKNFVVGKLDENIGKPKELWRSLKSFGLPSRKSSSSTICLEKDGILSFDLEANSEIFEDFYSNLANDLVRNYHILQINVEKMRLKSITKIESGRKKLFY